MNNISVTPAWELLGWGIGCIILIFAVVISYLVGVQTGRRQERSLIAKMKIQKNKVSIFRYRQTILELEEQITCIEEEKTILTARSESVLQVEMSLQKYRNQITELEQAIGLLSTDNQELNDFIVSKAPKKSNIDVSLLLQSLKNDPVHTNLSKEEWDVLLNITDVFFNNCLKELKVKADITRHDQEICCLIKWNFSRKEQMAIFNNTSDALTKSKSRLKKRLGLDEKTDLDQYIRLY